MVNLRVVPTAAQVPLPVDIAPTAEPPAQDGGRSEGRANQDSAPPAAAAMRWANHVRRRVGPGRRRRRRPRRRGLERQSPFRRRRRRVVWPRRLGGGGSVWVSASTRTTGVGARLTRLLGDGRRVARRGAGVLRRLQRFAGQDVDVARDGPRGGAGGLGAASVGDLQDVPQRGSMLAGGPPGGLARAALVAKRVGVAASRSPVGGTCVATSCVARRWAPRPRPRRG